MIITKEQFKDALDTAYRDGYRDCACCLPDDTDFSRPDDTEVQLSVERIVSEKWEEAK